MIACVLTLRPQPQDKLNLLSIRRALSEGRDQPPTYSDVMRTAFHVAAVLLSEGKFSDYVTQSALAVNPGDTAQLSRG